MSGVRPGRITLVRLSRSGFESTYTTETVTLTSTEQRTYQVAMVPLDVNIEGTVCGMRNIAIGALKTRSNAVRYHCGRIHKRRWNIHHKDVIAAQIAPSMKLKSEGTNNINCERIFLDKNASPHPAMRKSSIQVPFLDMRR